MLKDFVLETANAPGTATTVNLAGAATGRCTFAQKFSSGANAYYYLDDGTQAEWGWGVFTSGSPNTITRAVVLGNTAGTTARLNFAGVTRVYNEVPAAALPWLDTSSNLTLPGTLAVKGAVFLNASDGSASQSAIFCDVAGVNGSNTVQFRTGASGSYQYTYIDGTGVMHVPAGITAGGLDSGGANIRAVGGSYGAMLRNDGANVYLLQTASGSPTGTFNTFRPFVWNLSTGAVTIDATGAGVTLGGALTVGAGGSFASSLSGNGYQKLPGGLIIQWGTGNTGAGGGVAVNYPIAFPSTCYSFVATVNGATSNTFAGMIAVGPSSSTATNVFSANSTTGNGVPNVGFNWVAVGR